MKLAKRGALILLLLAMCFAMGFADSAETRVEFVIFGAIFVVLALMVFLPVRWWLK